ncbi:MAG: CIA30 family protein [Leptolyngbya sp. UWPOB_LEPTO1]|uniref:CIA30 family protein n=1 Tax=Leptolyngbya sp. UWPOB_LEPTO1 TaxID=2815653 RepID=UPI001AC85788|nr:CIA30 family protein [Leptolyngbya sp. UWPOB_LEPTO1]MBN8563962.1 CIA30 family protein [Leptolyngbya sp. UWPOB_LEPTO1]
MAQWDLGRFVQTLEYFEAIPVVSWLQNMFQPRPKPLTSNETVLFDFNDSATDLKNTWGALDDVVMGGVSNSGIRLEGGVAVFTGNVSIENSGGFASIRTRNFDPPLDLSNQSGIELRIKGDGNRYKFLIRDSDGWDSTGYSYSFDTVSGEWMTIQIPFAQTIPVFRAKTVPNAKLSSKHIRSLQLMLSKFEYDGTLNPRFNPGTFRLEILSIAAY